MAPCGFFSVTYRNEHMPLIIIYLQVPHFFNILLRLLQFNLENGYAGCNQSSSMMILTLFGLPWTEEEYSKGYRFCGRIPVTDIVFRNRIKISIISKTYFLTMKMTFVYTVINQKVNYHCYY